MGRTSLIARNGGTIVLNGTITNNGTLINTGTITDPQNVIGHNATVAVNLNVHGSSSPVMQLGHVYAASFRDAQVTLPGAGQAGFTFDGWYTARTGGSLVTATTDLGLGGPKNITLFARWTPGDVGSTPGGADGGTPGAHRGCAGRRSGRHTGFRIASRGQRCRAVDGIGTGGSGPDRLARHDLAVDCADVDRAPGRCCTRLRSAHFRSAQFRSAPCQEEASNTISRGRSRCADVLRTS